MKGFIVAAILLISSAVKANNGLQPIEREVSDTRMAALEGQVTTVVTELSAMETRLRQEDQNIRNEVQAGRVFFSACVNQDQPYTFNTAIKFDSVIDQYGGSNYNKNTGEFTCPRNGIYYFQFSTATSVTINFQHIQKNGVSLVTHNAVNVADGIVDSSSIGLTLQCNQGNKVRVFSGSSQQYKKGCQHVFTGFMVHPL